MTDEGIKANFDRVKHNYEVPDRTVECEECGHKTPLPGEPDDHWRRTCQKCSREIIWSAKPTVFCSDCDPVAENHEAIRDSQDTIPCGMRYWMGTL